MRAVAIRTALLLTASVILGWSGTQTKPDGTSSRAVRGSVPRNPTLYEVRQQCNEIAAFFPVDMALARHWVPPAYKLEVDAQGKAGGAVIFLNCPKYSRVTTPNAPPFQTGENTAPGSIVHFWFMLQGTDQVLPVPGAQVTSPTKYAYAVADFITSPIMARVYRRAGKNPVLVRETDLLDEGERQKGKIIFANGHKITLDADTPTQLPTPLRFGGNIWQWHVADRAQNDVGLHRDPAVGKPGDVIATRTMFLATAPGPPNTTRVTIHAESGTPFAEYFGTEDVVASRASFFRPNNIVSNSSRGELLWTTYPPRPLQCPPLIPE